MARTLWYDVSPGDEPTALTNIADQGRPPVYWCLVRSTYAVSVALCVLHGEAGIVPTVAQNIDVGGHAFIDVLDGTHYPTAMVWKYRPAYIPPTPWAEPEPDDPELLGIVEAGKALADAAHGAGAEVAAWRKQTKRFSPKPPNQ